MGKLVFQIIRYIIGDASCMEKWVLLVAFLDAPAVRLYDFDIH